MSLKWYASRDGEAYTVGPCDSRDEVIQTARTDFDSAPFWVVEATQDPLKLSDTISGGDVLVEAQEGAWDEHAEPGGDPIGDDVTDAQIDDLTARLRRAADEWQAAHRIVFVPWMFTRMENLEKVEPEAETQP